MDSKTGAFVKVECMQQVDCIMHNLLLLAQKLRAGVAINIDWQSSFNISN
jgi:hypothetical protein